MQKILINLFIVFILFSGCSSINNSILDTTHQSKISLGINDKELSKQDIFLKLDAHSHTDIIKDIVITKNKKFLVTGGEDSYVRIWDIKTGEMLRKISGYIGTDGSTGNIYALALSPDNKYLAVAGNFSKTGTSEKNMFSDDIKTTGAIRIHDFKTGALLQLLYGHNNVVNDLSFSPDGKILLSASVDSNINIWKVENNFKKINQISHSINARALDIVNVTKGYQITSVSTDGTVKLSSFDLVKNKLVLLKSQKDNTEFSDVKISKNFIVVTSLRKILVFNRKLRLLHIIKTNKPYNFRPRFTKDEKYLICAGSEVYVYDVKDNFKVVKSYLGHQDTVRGLELLDDETIVSASFNINVYNYKKDISSKRFKSLSSPIYRVGLTKNKIAFGHKKYNDKKRKFDFNDRGPLEKVFDLNSRKVSSVKNIKPYNLMSRKYGWQRLSPVQRNTKLAVYDRNIKMTEIPTGLLSPGTRNRTFGFYNKDEYILTALDRSIYSFSNSFFDIFHQPESIFIGHTGVVFAMATYEDTLLSGSTDRTLKLWSLKDIGDKDIVSSKLNLFVADDNEWIMWTNDGYFDSSANGYKYIGFHINNGADKNAKFISIEKLYDHFFRPDLVKLALNGTDISKYTNNLSYKQVLQNPPPSVFIKTDNNIETKQDEITIAFEIKEIDGGGVGAIRIYQEGKLVKTLADGNINRDVNDVINKENEEKLDKLLKQKQKEYLAELEASSKSVNGLDTSDLVGDVESDNVGNIAGTYSITLPLKAGENSISIEAFNKTNTVLSVRKHIDINAKIKKRIPKIYVIAAGLNEFEHDNVSQLKYSENDAKTIAKEIKNATEYKTEVTLLTGKKVTKENILKAIKKIKKKAHLEDKIVFYISTHGKAARGRLYLVPQNNKKLKNWINFEEIFKEIQAVAALDQIFIIDACESGQASDIMSSVYDAKASVLAKQSGVHLLMATTKGTFAFESADKNIKHGVFTNNILKALKRKTTDENKNGKISIIELSKALQEPEYSVNHQFPIIRNVGEDTYIKKVKK